MADFEPSHLFAPEGPKGATRRRYGRTPANDSELRLLREARDWTIEQAVEWLAGFEIYRSPSRGTWKKWESGERTTPAIVLRLLRGEVQLTKVK